MCDRRAPTVRYVRQIAIGGALLAVLLTACWKLWLEPRLVAKRWGVVVPGVLYRSGQLSRFVVEGRLEQHGIRRIVDLTGVDGSADQLAEERAAARLNIAHLRFPLIGDGTGDVTVFATAVATVAEGARDGIPTLVHCHAGAQRTGAVVAAYRLLVEGRSPHSVLDELRAYGWNPRKDQVLREYLNAHLADVAELLAERRLIPQVPDPLPLLP